MRFETQRLASITENSLWNGSDLWHHNCDSIVVSLMMLSCLPLRTSRFSPICDSFQLNFLNASVLFCLFLVAFLQFGLSICCTNACAHKIRSNIQFYSQSIRFWSEVDRRLPPRAPWIKIVCKLIIDIVIGTTNTIKSVAIKWMQPRTKKVFFAYTQHIQRLIINGNHIELCSVWFEILCKSNEQNIVSFSINFTLWFPIGDNSMKQTTDVKNRLSY